MARGSGVRTGSSLSTASSRKRQRSRKSHAAHENNPIRHQQKPGRYQDGRPATGPSRPTKQGRKHQSYRDHEQRKDNIKLNLSAIWITGNVLCLCAPNTAEPRPGKETPRDNIGRHEHVSLHVPVRLLASDSTFVAVFPSLPA